MPKTNKTIKLADGAVVKYYQNFVSKTDANKLYDGLKDTTDWKHGVYKMFGKDVETPRVLHAMRDKDTDISDVYDVTGSTVWSKEVKSLKKKVEKETGHTFRYAQLNYYRDGNDYIGFHTDSEVQEGDIIASISLGVRRKFVFRHINYKTNDVEKYEMMLDHGSLLIMNEQAAKLHWKHSLPKMAKVRDGRINITFRPN
jgi:alkylated DNA repair dioxygenase AlkB